MAKHVWRRDSGGIDYIESGHCGGPTCLLCSAGRCQHCDPAMLDGECDEDFPDDPEDLAKQLRIYSDHLDSMYRNNDELFRQLREIRAELERSGRDQLQERLLRNRATAAMKRVEANLAEAEARIAELELDATSSNDVG